MEPSSVRRLSLRELMVLARERLGEKAAALKTREELVRALFGAVPGSSPSQAARLEAPAAASEPPPPPPVRTIVTRDFFLSAEPPLP
jgi:hypothetical protein